jgi:hypothetical protein
MDLKKIFEKRVSKEPKVRSINGVFIAKDNTLENTNYKPYYQRNYVWDDEKATYFIESIFLGTEVPPIILFKSEKEDGFINYEVIDGRQRYQSILRFINNELKLKKSGLQRLYDLSDFVGKTFSELKEQYQKLFKDTKIRTIEYSFITEYSREEEETVKREIFQRYNSGITPLKSFEIDKAQYYYNDLNQGLKALLNEDSNFNNKVTRIFRWEKMNVDQKVAKFRELLVLHRIPIKYYATKKQTIISKYFEYISTQLAEDSTDIYESLKTKIDYIAIIEKTMLDEDISYNRLYAECLFWAFSVMEQNEISYNSIIEKGILDKLITFFKKNEESFTTIKSSFYNELIKRYQTTASFFEKEFSCSFQCAIENNENFKHTNKLLPTNITNTESSVESKSFEDLRINKPEPTSVELTELLDNLRSNRFILRPPYQRADVKNRKKSSAIIESMLLGIMLPPIFVFKRIDGTSEVVDGQQRLLSIISFIGETYMDENGNAQQPLLYNFKLDLAENAILKELNGSSYSDLSKAEQNKIRKTSIYIIEIKEEKNKGFDPVDLFVRLNNKPYPIARDSFEMWNSFAPRNIIESIKLAVENNEKWFYLRKNNSRMDNENLYTSLVYFQYMHILNDYEHGSIIPNKTIEIFVIDKRLACRFRLRNNITKLMYKSDNIQFIEAVNQIEFNFVSNLKIILSNSNNLSKELDSLMKVENGKRTQMSFYILWLLLHDMPYEVLKGQNKCARNEIYKILQMTDFCTSTDAFISAVKDFREKYSIKRFNTYLNINDIAVVNNSSKLDLKRPLIVLQKKPRIDKRFNAQVQNAIEVTNDAIYIQIYREGFDIRYIEAYFRSKLFYYHYTTVNNRIISAITLDSSLPFIDLEKQKVFINILDYINISSGLVKNYFERLLDLMFYECIFPSAFQKSSINIYETLKNYPSIENLLDSDKIKTVHEIYEEQTNTNSIIGMYLLKAVDIEEVRTIEKKINDEKNYRN